MKEKNKISLLQDINRTIRRKKDGGNVKKEYIIDERVIAEKNKVMSAGYTALVVVLFIFSMIAEANNLIINTTYVSVIIGTISYSMLLILCKKMAIKENPEMLGLFIWSFFTLPISTFNIISDFMYEELLLERLGFFIIPVPIIIIVLVAIVLYQIANTVYKNANKEE